MKTKNKLIAFVQIAIVLCSVFLVAIPAIAADQNQTMQKVSASGVTTASEDDYVLGVYGNANEDDTIDMGDVVYIKLAIFGKKPKTELCDAKYDGRINVLDVIQTKLIILGREKEITVVDSADRIVTVKKPVDRLIVFGSNAGELIQLFGVPDKVVGVGTRMVDDAVFFHELSKLPSCGVFRNPDYEKILELKPDIIITLGSQAPKLEDKLGPAGITVVGIDAYKPETMAEDVKKVGYILGKKNRAREFIDFYQGYLDTIAERVEGISDEDKPRVCLEFWSDYYILGKGKGSSFDQLCKMAGGINIASLSGKIDPEWVIEQNPSIYIRGAHGSFGVSEGYNADDPAEIKALREAIMSRPGWVHITAVKNENVHIMTAEIVTRIPFVVGAAYMAKFFHPELFKDLDPEAIHQEYLTRFQRLDYDLNEHGIFAYPPIEIDDGLAGIPDRYKGQI